MQLISYSTEEFKAAAERTDNVPSHAAEIEGKLIHINTKNLNGWGVQSSAVKGILEKGIGIPVRMCNSLNPHVCDDKTDHISDIGFVTQMWEDDGWIKAKAAITDKPASQKVNDGTWLPFGKGDWSVYGAPGTEINEHGLLNNFTPTAVSFVRLPAKPAFIGSNFERVSAAVDEIKETLHSKNDEHNIKEEIMADEKEDIKTDDSSKNGQNDTKDVKTEPKVEPKTEVNLSKGDEVAMYSQDDFDKKLVESLETQKHDFEEQMANMTKNSDLESMLSAAKKETIDETLDNIKRDKLTDEYMEMLTASTILKAPFMVNGKLDDAKLMAHSDDTKMLSAAVIETKIAHAKAMVAAMPAGTNAFDHADVPGNVQDNDFNDKMSKLGVTHVEFS